MRSFGPSDETFWIWFGGIWLAVGLPFLLIGLWVTVAGHIRDQRLDERGRATEGVVLDRSLSPGADGAAHTVRYRFTLRDGRTFDGEARVDSAAWERLVEMRSVRVTYLPDDPETHRVEGEARDWVLGLVFSGLGGIFALLGGFVFVRGWMELRRGRRGARRARR